MPSEDTGEKEEPAKKVQFASTANHTSKTK